MKVEMEIKVGAILKQINPPIVNIDNIDYCNNVECPYLDNYFEECKLFNQILEFNHWDDAKRCPQCKELTKLLEELK